MSHLPLVMQFKENLVTLGITCPVEVAKQVSEPFVSALIRGHFKYNQSFLIQPDEEARIWNQLDTWNKISPINAPFIFESVKVRFAEYRISMIKTGYPTRTERPADCLVSLPDGTVVDVTQVPAFEPLVAHLQQELEHCHE